MAKIPMALQLYSIREDCTQDLPKCLEAVAKMGYDGVEFAGYYGRTAEELKAMLGRKIVFVGVTATGSSDVGPTPVDTNTPLVHTHLVAASNILNNTFMLPVSRRGQMMILALFWLLLVACGLTMEPMRYTYVLSGGVLAYAGLTFYLIKIHRYVLPFFGPTIFVILSLVGVVVYDYFTEEKEKKKIRGMFSTMVSGEVLQFMEDRPETFSLSGERREATIFFSDVAGFTTISESLKPDQLVELLNQYLTPMTDIILRNEGYVDKYEGDAIMAEWGVPYPNENHAWRACFSAIEQQQRLAELRPGFLEEFGHRIDVRMGVNSGVVSAGNMGSQKRFSYTVMGDAVNQAARFEPTNKDYDTLIIIGQTTHEMAKDKIEDRLLDLIVVKGKTEPISIYELIAKKGQLEDDMRQVMDRYDEGLHLHRDRKWDESLTAFRGALEISPEDGPSLAMIARVEAYKNVPPPDAWQGEYIRATKD